MARLLGDPRGSLSSVFIPAGRLGNRTNRKRRRASRPGPLRAAPGIRALFTREKGEGGAGGFTDEGPLPRTLLWFVVLGAWENRLRMKRFSQRKGLKPVAEVIQIDSMNSELRNSLWNTLNVEIWLYDRTPNRRLIELFSDALWSDFFKKPTDSVPDNAIVILAEIREHFFACEWFEVHDFLEFAVEYFKPDELQLAESLNLTLERELSGYRFVSGHLTDITNAQEIEMLETELADSRFAGVYAHLQQALDLYAKRENPDYRNSIKESISAVESMARIVSGNPKATLSDALKEIEKKGLLHKSLKGGFIKLYGYTNDADGIRHAIMDVPKLTQADARYFLLSCTSFVNYLKAQLGSETPEERSPD